jgi:4-aminobutyrate aminotransferase-like enzyme
VLRFVPPLVITPQEIDQLIDTLNAIFTRLMTEPKDAHRA